MDKIYTRGYAKINLSIDVLNKREDGYHDVEMIMQTVSLFDEVIIKKVNQKKIDISTDSISLPTDENNIAYKAAKLLIDEFKIDSGVEIFIKKNIPMSAGMAGGSTDAACVFKGMNKLFSLKIPENKLMELGKRIGADVPYCIVGGTAIVRGIGEKLTKLKKLNELNIVLVKPPIDVSTGWIYKNLKIDEITKRPDTEGLLEAIKRNDIEFISKNLVNVLETVTIKEYKVIDEIKSKLVEYGAIGSLMSGSGPTVFGIFENSEISKQAEKKLLNDNLGFVYTVKSI